MTTEIIVIKRLSIVNLLQSALSKTEKMACAFALLASICNCLEDLYKYQQACIN
jgi:hypothetical protein